MSVLVVIHMGLLGFEQRGKARGFRGLTLGREADDGLHVGGGCIVPGALEAVVAVGHQCHAGLALGGKDGGVAGGALGGLALKAWGPTGVFAATSALALVREKRGSTWMIVAPRRLASMTHWNPTGCASAMLAPHVMMTSASSMSA